VPEPTPTEPTPTEPTPTDTERLAAIAAHLAEVLADAAEPWARARLADRLGPIGAEPGPANEVDAAVAAYRDAVVPALRALLGTDIDAQRTTPLSILRDAVPLLHPPLEAAGVPEAVRDDLDRARDPDDRWALAPATWSDLGPEVADAGITWGAAKAHVHLARRRATAEGASPDREPQEPGGAS